MFCQYCGKEINDNADICIYCGRKTHEDVQLSSEIKTSGEIVEIETKITFICLCAISLLASFVMPTLAFESFYGGGKVFSILYPWTPIIQFALFASVVGAALFTGFNKRIPAGILYTLYLLFVLYCRFSTDYWVIMPAANILLIILLLTEFGLFLDILFKSADEQKRRIFMIVIIGLAIVLLLIGFIAPKTLTMGVIF